MEAAHLAVVAGEVHLAVAVAAGLLADAAAAHLVDAAAAHSEAQAAEEYLAAVKVPVPDLVRYLVPESPWAEDSAAVDRRGQAVAEAADALHLLLF